MSKLKYQIKSFLIFKLQFSIYNEFAMNQFSNKFSSSKSERVNLKGSDPFKNWRWQCMEKPKLAAAEDYYDKEEVLRV